MSRLLASILGTWIGLLALLAAQEADQTVPPPPRDAALDQLRSIQLPHIFSPVERSLIDNQLDILRLGIDLFMAQERQLSPDNQQSAFNNAWPILRCIFAKDFDTPPSCPGSNPTPSSASASNSQPPPPQTPGSLFNNQ